MKKLWLDKINKLLEVQNAIVTFSLFLVVKLLYPTRNMDDEPLTLFRFRFGISSQKRIPNPYNFSSILKLLSQTHNYLVKVCMIDSFSEQKNNNKNCSAMTNFVLETHA